MRRHYAVLRHKDGRKKIVDNVQKRLTYMRRRLFTWARLVTEAGYRSAYRVAMVTLTYDVSGSLVAAANWEAGHMRQFMHRLKKRMGERLKAAAWVAELQGNGHVHYHLMVIFEGRFLYPDRPCIIDGVRYKRLWPYGMSRVDFKVKTLYYVCSYVGKEYQKNFMDFPEGAHAWSVWIGDPAMHETLRFESLDDLGRQLVGTLGWAAGLYEYRDLRRAVSAERGWSYAGSYLTRGLAEVMAGEA